MYDNFGPLGIKVLNCHVYLKAVTYTNTEETRLWNEQKSYETWNIWTNEKTWVLKNVLPSSRPIWIIRQQNFIP